jgi:hypothetical protein
MKNSLGPREQALLRLYTNCQFGLSPSDFYAKWNVTHAQMAQICGCSVSTVDRWFLHGAGYRAPEPIYFRRLAEINFLWENYEQIPDALKEKACHRITPDEP